MKEATTNLPFVTSEWRVVCQKGKSVDRWRAADRPTTFTLINDDITSVAMAATRTVFPGEMLRECFQVRSRWNIATCLAYVAIMQILGIVITTARIDGAFLFRASPFALLFFFSRFFFHRISVVWRPTGSSRIPYFFDVSYEPMRTVVKTGRTLILFGR